MWFFETEENRAVERRKGKRKRSPMRVSKLSNLATVTFQRSDFMWVSNRREEKRREERRGEEKREAKEKSDVGSKLSNLATDSDRSTSNPLPLQSEVYSDHKYGCLSAPERK